MNHLDALELRLSNERMRLTRATSDKEKELRCVWIQQIEKEIVNERKFRGDDKEMTDDEILQILRG